MQKPSNTITIKKMTLGFNIKQKQNPATPNEETVMYRQLRTV